MDATKIGMFIAALRRSRGMTQQEVAQSLGITDKTVSKWETGNGYPDITMIPALAELFGVTTDEILRGERIIKDKDVRAGVEHEKQKAYLLNSAGYRVNNQILCSIGASIGAAVTLFLLGSSTFYAPVCCGVSILLCIVSVVIALTALSKARFISRDREICRAAPSAMKAFRETVLKRMRLAFAGIAYSLALSLIIWFVSGTSGGLITVFELYNPLVGLIAAAAAILAFCLSKGILKRALDHEEHITIQKP